MLKLLVRAPIVEKDLQISPSWIIKFTKISSLLEKFISSISEKTTEGLVACQIK